MLKVPNVCKIRRYLPVADPGFPRAGSPTLRGGGAPTYDFAKFSQKLHEIERIWTPGGGARPKFYYVDPPLPPPLYLAKRSRHSHHMWQFCIYIGNVFPPQREFYWSVTIL